MTDKSDNKVGYLNSILARGGGNLNDPIFKSSNVRGLPGGAGGGGMLKFRVDRRISDQHQISPCNINAYSTHEAMGIKDMITQGEFSCYLNQYF